MVAMVWGADMVDGLFPLIPLWSPRMATCPTGQTGHPRQTGDRIFSEDELLASSQETVEGKALGHNTPTTIKKPTTSTKAMGQKRANKGPSKYKLYQRSLTFLDRILKNETEGKAHPKDESDKAKCQKVVDEYLAFQTEQDDNKTATKKHKISDLGAVVPRDHLQMALVDETSNGGKPVLDKWSEIEARLFRIIVDYVMANPEGQTPGFDLVEVVRGCRVIKCDDQYSLHFLTNAIGEIQSSWEGLKLKLIPASEIPRRPRTRIWIPNMEFEAHQLIPYLQAHNRSVPIADWSIIKAEAPQNHCASFLLQITE
ncbi:uncharacterized protein LOC129250240 [Anastrepha obliqua]|uniref:uncharacterized protein LOC129250240 n=1 Tax=Anastrepha obliqua TaxID=95512 RepID=UPI0024098D4C|nr:uncharacterized protein LOC129250240 [Anastrepha obliqua]